MKTWNLMEIFKMNFSIFPIHKKKFASQIIILKNLQVISDAKKLPKELNLIFPKSRVS